MGTRAPGRPKAADCGHRHGSCSAPVRMSGPGQETVLASCPSLQVWLATASALQTGALPWGRSISRSVHGAVCPATGLERLLKL